MSIRIRLTLWYTAIFGTTLIVFSLLLYYLLFINLIDDIDQSIAQKAGQVVESTQIIDPFFLPFQQIILPDVDVFATPDTFLQVVDGSGVIRARSNNLGNRLLPLSEETLVRAEKGQAFFETLSVDGGKIRLYNTPLIANNKIVGILQVGRSLASLEAALERLRLLLIAGTFIALIIAATVGNLLARSALRPINKITQTAADIEKQEDLSRRIDYRGPQDEVGKLATTFNTMLDRLQALYQRLHQAYTVQQRFVADASHELRTPLTTIGGNVEFLKKLGDQDSELRSETLNDIHDEVRRMNRLVEDMLALARADAGQQIPKQPLKLTPFLQEIATLALKRAVDKSFTFLDADSGVAAADFTVLANRDYLERAIFVLIDNAFKYTPPSGRVEMFLSRQNDLVGISIRDYGVGIKEKDLPHIFERFYRGDSARQAGGTGLGLSIAKWIVEEHKGKITVDTKENAGSTFTIWLPVSK